MTKCNQLIFLPFKMLIGDGLHGIFAIWAIPSLGTCGILPFSCYTHILLILNQHELRKLY